ncbi:MAG: CdaR family protein, partial [Lactococcus garvieae]
MRNNFFASKLFTILASIFFAVILFFNASSAALRNQGSSTTGEVYTTTISNVPIEIKYNSDEYFASGYNNTANVYLTSYNRVQINTEENPDSRNFYLVVDLSNAKEGTVTMPVRIQQLPNGINAQIEPTTLTVRLEKKASAEFNVTPLIEQAQLPDGFKVNDIKLSQ